MAVITGSPMRGDKIVDEEGELTEAFARFLYDLETSNNEDNPKKNFRATAPPAVTNNTDEGYTVGSEWIDAPTVYKLTSFTGTNANWTALN